MEVENHEIEYFQMASEDSLMRRMRLEGDYVGAGETLGKIQTGIAMLTPRSMTLRIEAGSAFTAYTSS
jgi:hypothetical protein